MYTILSQHSQLKYLLFMEELEQIQNRIALKYDFYNNLYK